MPCARCPVAPDRICPGERASQLCRLIDPADPIYDPRYVTTIPLHARPRSPDGPPAPASVAVAVATARPTAAESMARLAIAKACPYRSKHPPCGCAGARCGLRRGAIVSHVDCLDCVRRYG